jgi:dTDP-4-amino-4,6-dideoxygalactose transaminase
MGVLPVFVYFQKSSNFACMKTIAIEVQDNLLAYYGQVALQAKVQKMLEWEALRLKMQNLQTQVQEAQLDHDALFEEARASAWETYKKTVLRDILPQNV